MSRLFRAVLAVLSLAAVLGLPTTVRAADPPKVAIIVGPVGELTPMYLRLAELAATTAQGQGATVARAYSPNATPANVLAAVADANVVIYFGHGYGHPSPYGGLNTAKQNGWALQGPAARGTHGDAGGQIAYYGEDWIVANARPAPGFVMIYSNTCYAPGASEGVEGHPAATAWVAAQRVAYYSRSTFTLGGSAYYATDFDEGAADLVGRILANRDASFGSAFVSDRRYVPSGLTIQPHLFSSGQQIWLHRSKYTDGPPNYWYAFAGNPDLTPRRAWDRAAPTATLLSPADGASEVGTGASVRVGFNEPVVGVSASTISLTDAGGAAVAATVSYDAAKRVVTVNPEASLRLSDRYTISLAAGIADAAGRALKPAAWTFSTRVDADPLTRAMPIALEAGTHELVRFAPDGSVAETRAVDVETRYWLTADQRARPLGQQGSWYRIADAAHAGWWLRESAAAHGLGALEDVALVPAAVITLPAGEHQVFGFGDGPQVTELTITGSRDVTVDRRRVVDGHTYLRLADTHLAGAWVRAAADLVDTEPLAQRLLKVEARPAPATIALDGRERVLFRFDASGRVIERATVPAGESRVLATSETRIVAGVRFLVLDGGERDGWAVLEDAGVQVLNGSPPAAPLG